MTPEEVAALPTFRHRPLDTTKQHTRLLKFTRLGTAIHGEIHVTRLNRAPAYQALSYTWGSSTPTVSISIDYTRFEISQNLYAFLKRFYAIQGREVILKQSTRLWSKSESKPFKAAPRRATLRLDELEHIREEEQIVAMQLRLRNFERYIKYSTPEYVWIDQICIDQSSPTERSHQVGLMSQIYQKAALTMVWLGNTTIDMRACNLRDPAHIASILHDPYFSRLWIVQEFLLAPRIEFLAQGTQSFEWEALSNTVISLETTLRLDFGVSENVLRLIRQRRGAYNNSLGYYISSFCGNGCADTRDKVFGLMGLCRGSETISIDYNKTAYQVYLDVVMAFRNTYLTRQSYPRHTYLSDQNYPPTLLKQYPFHHKDYFNVLMKLKDQMITAKELREGLVLMLEEIWMTPNLRTTDIFADDLHIQQMGLIPGICLHRKGELLEGASSDLRSRWWYTSRKATRYFACPSEDSSQER